MKRTSIVALLALLGAVNGAKNIRSLLERAQEDDDIDMGKMDLGFINVSNTNKKHHHHHPRDK